MMAQVSSEGSCSFPSISNLPSPPFADVEKMTKMSKLLEILCNPTQRVQLDTLLKCEKALEKMDLFSYSGQQFGVSLPPPPLLSLYPLSNLLLLLYRNLRILCWKLSIPHCKVRWPITRCIAPFAPVWSCSLAPISVLLCRQSVRAWRRRSIRPSTRMCRMCCRERLLAWTASSR